MAARIYVVEDEGITAIGLRRLLRDWGYEVPNFAFSGVEACRKIDDINPDLVLMDIMVKGEYDGIEAAEHIKNHFDVPIIFITAYNSNDLIERAKKVGYEYYIVKPYDEEDLRQKIENVLSKYGIKSRTDDKEKIALNEQDPDSRINQKNVKLTESLKTDNPLTAADEEYTIEESNADLKLIDYGINLSKNFDNDKNAIVIVDSDGYLKYMDINSESFMRYDRESVISKSFDEFVKSTDGSRVTDVLVKEPLNRGIAIKSQITLVINNEFNVDVKYRSLPVRIDNGNFAGVCIIFEDIDPSGNLEETEKVFNLENALNEHENAVMDENIELPEIIEKEEVEHLSSSLKESNDYGIDFKTIYLKLPIPVAIFNSKGLMMYLNQAAFEMFKSFNLTELEDINIFEEFNFEEEEKINFFNGKDTAHIFNYKLAGSKSDIGFNGYEAHLIHLDFWENDPCSMAVFHEKYIYENNQENEELYKYLVENNSNALCVFSPDGRIDYANKTFYTQLETEDNYFDIFPNALKIRIKMSINSLCDDNDVVSIKNLTKMPDDHLKLWTWVYKGIFDENGDLININSSGYQLSEDMDEERNGEEEKETIANESHIKRIMKKIF